MGTLLSLLMLLPFSRALPHPQREHLVGHIIPSSPGGERKLHGRFLHITDFHPDPFYESYSSTTGDSVCHRGSGPAGFYGAETSDCDSPVSLVNATFQWIEENIKESIDFIVWTGDSARHDNDEQIPRSDEQIVAQNELIAGKFFEVFCKPDNDNDADPTNDLTIPIVPTFGNNDILPHNIFDKGPNRWTLKYLEIWRRFIPEEQRHQFQRGGWFYVEVIPGKLAVFSLNTLYFFESNSAVDGCASKKEPGYEQFEWLRVQLQFMRERGMKAILMGHVPPARTENKMSWDETCWQKYSLWMQQYRDVIVTQLFGHMNINHFMLQDFHSIDKDISRGIAKEEYPPTMSVLEDELTIQSASDYLIDLRNSWAKLPSVPPPKAHDSWWNKIETVFESKTNEAKEPEYDQIGGPWGERYSISHVQSSIVPNYLPTLRIFEYNITGLESLLNSRVYYANSRSSAKQNAIYVQEKVEQEKEEEDLRIKREENASKKKKNKKKDKKKKQHKFIVPQPPSKATPPGPAYSPQTFSLLGYTHYLANLTQINNDFTDKHKNNLEEQKWKEGKHRGKNPKDIHKKPQPKEFKFEVEYSTFDDDVFGLHDLTVRSYLDLARRIGAYAVGKKEDGGKQHVELREEQPQDQKDGKEEEKKEKEKEKKEKEKKKKKGKGLKKHRRTKEWFTFVQRAFIETVDPTTIERQYGVAEIEDL